MWVPWELPCTMWRSEESLLYALTRGHLISEKCSFKHWLFWGKKPLGKCALRRMQCFSSTLCLHEGAVGTIPCDALRAWSMVWRDVRLSQKSVQTEFMWFSCFARLCTMWDSGDRLGYGLTRFIFVKENLGYGLKGCRMMSPNLKVREVKLIWVIFVFIHQPRISNYNHL